MIDQEALDEAVRLYWQSQWRDCAEYLRESITQHSIDLIRCAYRRIVTEKHSQTEQE